MVDEMYVRGWGDCLEAMDSILNQAKTLDEIKNRVNKLARLIQDSKFEKIKHELGAFGLF